MTDAMTGILKRHETLARRLLQAGIGRGSAERAAAAEQKARRQIEAEPVGGERPALRRQAAWLPLRSETRGEGADAAGEARSENPVSARASVSAENGGVQWEDRILLDAHAPDGGLTPEALSRLFAREARRYD